jgi:hypothetical protein
MVCFQTKNPNLGGSFNGRCWYILWTLGPFHDLLFYLWTFGIVRGNLVIFSRFGILYQEKSGNPGWKMNFSSLKML